MEMQLNETSAVLALEPRRCACGKIFTPRSAQQHNCTTECAKKYYRSKPRVCDCGEMGTHVFGGDWECGRCERLRLPRQAEENRRRYPPRTLEDEFNALRWTRFAREWLLEEHRRQRVLGWRDHRYVL